MRGIGKMRGKSLQLAKGCYYQNQRLPYKDLQNSYYCVFSLRVVFKLKEYDPAV